VFEIPFFHPRPNALKSRRREPLVDDDLTTPSKQYFFKTHANISYAHFSQTDYAIILPIQWDEKILIGVYDQEL